ncbi:MAG: methyltransferase [Nanoarchaeota archaeon]|nr:methyltransferase [Nanoarchaeota archaeon]
MVYEPLEDSFLLQKWVSKLCKDKVVLDMGTGSGIQAITAFQAGAKRVVAADLDREAILEAGKNFKAKNMPIRLVESDLFSNIDDNEKFDIIIFNPPYLPYDENLVGDVDLSGGEIGNELSIRFLSEAVKHLNPEGFILLILSSVSDPFGTFAESKALGYDYIILEEVNLNMESLYCAKFFLRE